MSRYGVMVCGHGSRSQAAVDEFAVLAERLRDHFPDWPVEYGYLEFANPVIRDGLDKLRQAGGDPILAGPGMLWRWFGTCAAGPGDAARVAAACEAATRLRTCGESYPA